MRNKGLLKLIILIMVLFAFKSCKKDELSIAGDQKALLLKVNDTEKISVSHSGFNVKKLRWVSDNPDIATVNNSGTLTAVKPGIAVITASLEDGKLQDTCIVTVVRIKNYTTADGLLNNYVRTISADANGNIWFGTVNGVSKFDGEHWTSYTEADGLARYGVNCIYFDSENNAWFGTTEGVSEFDGTTWKTYTTNDGLVNNQVYAMTIDNDGNKWFGTNAGLSKFDGTNWTSYTGKNGLSGNYSMYFSLISDKINNNIWALTYDGVFVNYGNYWNPVSRPSTTMYGIFVDSYNNKWVATMDGIFEFNGSKWTKLIEHTENNLGFAHDIIFDNQDNIWFTSLGGIFKYDGRNISTFENENFQMINKTEINDIISDKDENIWIAKTFEGVFKLETK